MCESLALFCGFRRLPLSIARVAISTVSFYAALSIAPRALQTPLLTPGSHNVAFDIVFDIFEFVFLWDILRLHVLTDFQKYKESKMEKLGSGDTTDSR